MNLITLFELILIIMFTSHFLACAWSFLNRVEKEYFNVSKTWLEALNETNNVVDN